MKDELGGKIVNIVKAEIITGHLVSILFDDGKESIIDFKPCLEAHPHESWNYLLDEDEFAKNMKIDHGNLVWGENWDLSFEIANYYNEDLYGDYDSDNEDKRSIPTIIYHYMGMDIEINEHHSPIQIHGRKEGLESRAELIINGGELEDVRIKMVEGKEPLKKEDLEIFITFIKEKSTNIVDKWISVYVNGFPLEIERYE